MRAAGRVAGAHRQPAGAELSAEVSSALMGPDDDDDLRAGHQQNLNDWYWTDGNNHLSLCLSPLSPLSQPTWWTPPECSSTRPTTTRSPGSAPSGSTATGTPWRWASGPGHCMIRKMEAGRTFPLLTGIATFVKDTCKCLKCSKLYWTITMFISFAAFVSHFVSFVAHMKGQQIEVTKEQDQFPHCTYFISFGPSKCFHN